MYDFVKESAELIKSKTNIIPEIGIILGSGLGSLVEDMTDKEIIKYEEIVNFPVSTVKGHSGQLVFGKLNGVNVVAMQGRFHYFEGYSMKEVTYPVYVMKMLGVKNLIVTNSCGGINLDFEPGTLMIIEDFINLVSTNPLIGENDERFGPRFPDMSEPFNFELIDKLKEVGKENNIEFKEGVYASFMGPYYETRAEIRMIKTMGADAVGMSTVPETIVGNYLGMKVLGISCITNMATGIQKMKHSHDNVVKVANDASKKLCLAISEVVTKI